MPWLLSGLAGAAALLAAVLKWQRDGQTIKVERAKAEAAQQAASTAHLQVEAGVLRDAVHEAVAIYVGALEAVRAENTRLVAAVEDLRGEAVAQRACMDRLTVEVSECKQREAALRAWLRTQVGIGEPPT